MIGFASRACCEFRIGFRLPLPRLRIADEIARVDPAARSAYAVFGIGAGLRAGDRIGGTGTAIDRPDGAIEAGRIAAAIGERWRSIGKDKEENRPSGSAKQDG